METEAKAEAKGENEGLDTITRIQNEVANLSHMYYNFTGGLQEMAPPVSVTGEPVKVESDTSVEYNAEELATQIVNVHKKIDELIDSLEDIDMEEDEHIQAIIDIQGEHESMKARCEEDLKKNGEIFDILQDGFSVLAEYQLAHGKFNNS